MKAATAQDCQRLEQIPNIGRSLAADLRRIGIRTPADLRGRDGYSLYEALCQATGQRQDPCVLDTFLAATDFMAGAPARPWWAYTAARKANWGPDLGPKLGQVRELPHGALRRPVHGSG